MDRHQLDRGDSKFLEIVNRRGMREPGVGTALVGRYLGMQHREAFDMQFVNYRLVPRDVQQGIIAPVKVGIDDYAFWNERRAVAIVAAQVFVRMADRIAEQRV